MTVFPITTRLKLLFLTLLSTALLLSAGARLGAHELLPTIADVEVTEAGEVALELQINLEAFLAGIDLDAVENTNDDDAGPDYTELRAMAPQDLASQVPELVARWSAHPVLVAGEPLVLVQDTLNIPDDLGLEVPRISQLRLVADLPAGAETVTLNWPVGSGPLVLRQQGVEAPYTGYLDGGRSSPAIALAGGGAGSAMETFIGYIPVGFDHILPKGLDHILFVLGLFFLSTRLGPLVWQVSAFTLAHTVTLALGALGIVNVPGSIVEPLIALSIVYVAVENIFAKGLNPWRPVVIFAFGLLHGLGFASVLGEFGLPPGQFIAALIGFNIGVELGQLTVIALAFLAVGWFAKRDWYRARIAVPASCVIAAVGAYWCVERVFL
ncbi:HupE/UreJ family protein [uncultured Roseobacter sp.]|uniref:HupE/UreJ family protein n=1 Tax=uncultured Roseobacter sp. TaxID=114847 RepID=UPI00261FFB6D|nr:HupE/UreJ family protein [uncultured Roseobacter sp.]